MSSPQQHSHSSGTASFPPSASARAQAPPPPTPSFIFRGHDAPINSLEFFASNTFLVTGDEAGWICVWDIWKRRPVYKWQGHSASVLALKVIPIHTAAAAENTPKTVIGSPSRSTRVRAQADGNQGRVYIVSHGRDNVVHGWDINHILLNSLERPLHATTTPSTAGSRQDLAPIFSLPVNALNFCKMSIVAIDRATLAPSSSSVEHGEAQGTKAEKKQKNQLSRTHQHIFIAVPSPMNSTLIDIYDVIKPERTFASVGAQIPGVSSASAPLPMGDTKVESAMVIHLFQTGTQSKQDLSTMSVSDATTRAPETEGLSSGLLSMLVGYEGGAVTLFQESTPWDAKETRKQQANRKMDMVWSIKCHREPVLSMDVSPDLQYAVSSGCDNLLVRYNLVSHLQGVPEVEKIALKSNGIADVKIRSDGKILGLAGWDGRIRIYSAMTLKPLAVLKYHRGGLYCLDFADIHSHEATAGGTSSGGNDRTSHRSSEATSVDVENKEDVTGHGEEKDHDSESGSESDEDSDLEETLEERRQWSRRHWIAVGGKENSISLWEIY